MTSYDAAGIATAFTVGDGAGWIEALTGNRPAKDLLYLAAFLLFGIAALIRLVHLQAELDKHKERVRLVARPASTAWNFEKGLKRDEISLDTAIQLHIWADCDLDTDSLVLNLVGVRLRKWWEVWKMLLPTKKRLFAIHVVGQDSREFRRSIRAADLQPYKELVPFRWRGKPNWDGAFLWELALVTGRPAGTWRTIVVDAMSRIRGNISPAL